MGWSKKSDGSTPLGDRLKKERNRRGFSNLNNFAKSVNMSVYSITAIENRGAAPHVHNLIKIAQVLECSTDWLLGLED